MCRKFVVFTQECVQVLCTQPMPFPLLESLEIKHNYYIVDSRTSQNLLRWIEARHSAELQPFKRFKGLISLESLRHLAEICSETVISLDLRKNYSQVDYQWFAVIAKFRNLEELYTSSHVIPHTTIRQHILPLQHLRVLDFSNQNTKVMRSINQELLADLKRHPSLQVLKWWGYFGSQARPIHLVSVSYNT